MNVHVIGAQQHILVHTKIQKIRIDQKRKIIPVCADCLSFYSPSEFLHVNLNCEKQTHQFGSVSM